jgi:hypothetical protein
MCEKKIVRGGEMTQVALAHEGELAPSWYGQYPESDGGKKIGVTKTKQIHPPYLINRSAGVSIGPVSQNNNFVVAFKSKTPSHSQKIK